MSVQDHGIGIEQNELNKIFDHFSQVDFDEQRAYEGMGMGLSVAKALVALHQGKIYVSSAPQKGSTFTFTLPVHREQISQASKIRVNKRESEGPRRILVVDDEPVNRLVVSSILKAGGYECIEAESGEQALSKIVSEQPIDLVLLDIMMPKMSGYEVCRRLRTTFTNEDLPVIFLTAKSLDEALTTSLECGGDLVLQKPVTKKHLLEFLQQLFADESTDCPNK